MEISAEDPQKARIDLPHDQDTLLSGDAFSSMFIDVLVTMPGMWKQNRCPLTGEWIMRMWYIYTVEYYSSVRKIKL